MQIRPQPLQQLTHKSKLLIGTIIASMLDGPYLDCLHRCFVGSYISSKELWTALHNA